MYYIIFFVAICIYDKLNRYIENFIFKNSNYNLSANRKFYISKNISKSIILFFLSILSYKYVMDAVIYNKWSNENFYFFGTLYSAHDILSLYKAFFKLPNTTRLHHLSVLFLAYKNLYIDYTQECIWRGLVIYTYLSCLSFHVNTFLGVRFMYKRQKIWLYSKISWFFYGLLCLVNWSYQIYVLLNYNNNTIIENLFFCSLIGLVAYDDLNLLKYLYNF